MLLIMTWQPRNNVEQDRFDKLNRLQDMGVNPYPSRVERTHTAAEGCSNL